MNERKPIIGITKGTNQNFLMWFCAQQLVRHFGAKAVKLDHNTAKPVIEGCDGYILSGGSDINPVAYGQTNTHSIGIDDLRDRFEIALVQHALKYQKPILGICRGAQLLNIAKGGSLHQDALGLYDGFIPTDSLLGKILKRKKITIEKNSLLYQLVNQQNLKVNSIHHQAIAVLGEGLNVCALDEFNIIQAVESSEPDQFLLGVQWHPEFVFYSKIHQQLFKKLVDEAT